MNRLDIKKLVLGHIETNVYIVSSKETGECVIIDPAAKAEYIAAEIRTAGLKPVCMLLTHGHFDHILAVNKLREIFGISVYAMKEEASILADPRYTSESKAVTDFIPLPEDMNLLGCRWKVLHTPGHTIGSCCYYIEEEGILFSGDTLFYHTFGRTDLETGDEEMIKRSLKDILFKLPDETSVYPGHEMATNIRFEKENNDILRIG